MLALQAPGSPTNTAPDGVASTDAGSPVTIDVLGNDADADDLALIYVLQRQRRYPRTTVE